MKITELCQEAHNYAVSKGFWQEHRNNGELIALCHSELSEALEALREGNPKSKTIKGFSSLEEELADLVIRVGDFCGGRKLRLEEAIKAKLEYNKTRPFKHNRKF